MRPISDINNDITSATEVRDTDAMMRLADEAALVETYRGQLLASMTRARVSLMRGDLQTASTILERSLAMAVEEGDVDDQARILSDLGSCARYRGDLDQSLALHRRALETSHKGHKGPTGGTFHYNLALTLFELGVVDEAMKHVRMAIDCYDASTSPARVARAYGLMASIMGHGGAYDESMRWFHKALDLHERSGDASGRAEVLANIGGIYYDLERYEESITHYANALDVFVQGGYLDNAAIMHTNLGSAYRNVNDLTRSRHHLDQAVILYEQIGNKAGVSIAFCKLASHFIHIGAIADARRVLEEARSLHSIAHDVATQWALVESDLLVAENDVEGAQRVLLHGLEHALSAGVTRLVIDVHETLRDVALRRNDLSGYVHHNNAYTSLNEESRGKQMVQKLAMMEAERKIEAELRERDKERALLYGALPRPIADRLVRGEQITSDHFDHAAVLFIDVVGFTSHTANMHPTDVVQLLENVFRTFEGICDANDVIKIKTIGDSYMCFRGDADAETNALSVGKFAMEVMKGVFTWPDSSRIRFRAGIHLGPATAGVIGTQRLQYDVWGDTVNVASRMESTGEPGRVHVSSSIAEALRSERDFNLVPRGEVDIKGKGLMATYWLETRA